MKKCNTPVKYLPYGDLIAWWHCSSKIAINSLYIIPHRAAMKLRYLNGSNPVSEPVKVLINPFCLLCSHGDPVGIAQGLVVS